MKGIKGKRKKRKKRKKVKPGFFERKDEKQGNPD
jgi:hypothetical protein